MCDHCISRRGLLGMMPAALVPLRAPETSGWVEPRFRPRASLVGERRVALTLDACPGGLDRRITKVLVSERVKATLFLTETWMLGNPEGLRLLLDHPELFSLQDHGARHIPPVLGTGRVYGLSIAGTLENVRREVADGADAIKAVSGVMPLWYRGATARYSPEASAQINGMGYRIGAYSLSADQGASLPAATVAHRMASAKDGDVIIGHMNQPHRPSGEGIALGIIALRRAGFAFVHLNEIDPVLVAD
jgi:peptidoglycan/xylan/chitin deacetylase (PgdA/CDA1 family)